VAAMAGADEADSDGVVEDRRVVNELVGGAANGDTESGFAGLASLHTVECK
jgi:hypothetical protein